MTKDASSLTKNTAPAAISDGSPRRPKRVDALACASSSLGHWLKKRSSAVGPGDIQVDPRCVTLEALKEERRSDGASPWSAEVCYIGTLAL